MITADRLRELVRYDPETGVFTRILSTARNIKAGDVAGWVDESSGGYVRIMLDKVTYKAHNLAWLYMTGEYPESVIDHINRVANDNTWKNLRKCTNSQNNMNRSRHRNNTSGATGVSFDKESGKWMAYIYLNRKQIKLGRYADIDDAIKARRDGSIKYHKEYSGALSGSISEPILEELG